MLSCDDVSKINLIRFVCYSIRITRVFEHDSPMCEPEVHGIVLQFMTREVVTAPVKLESNYAGGRASPVIEACKWYHVWRGARRMRRSRLHCAPQLELASPAGNITISTAGNCGKPI